MKKVLGLLFILILLLGLVGCGGGGNQEEATNIEAEQLEKTMQYEEDDNLLSNVDELCYIGDEPPRYSIDLEQNPETASQPPGTGGGIEGNWVRIERNGLRTEVSFVGRSFVASTTVQGQLHREREWQVGDSFNAEGILRRFTHSGVTGVPFDRRDGLWFTIEELGGLVWDSVWEEYLQEATGTVEWRGTFELEHPLILFSLSGYLQPHSGLVEYTQSTLTIAGVEFTRQ